MPASLAYRICIWAVGLHLDVKHEIYDSREGIAYRVQHRPEDEALVLGNSMKVSLAMIERKLDVLSLSRDLTEPPDGNSHAHHMTVFG